MRKLLLIIFISLISSNSFAAAEKVYLKCLETVSENQIPATEPLHGDYEAGTFLRASFAELDIKKTTAKIMVYLHVEDGAYRSEGYNKKLEALTKTGKGSKKKVIVDGNTYTYKLIDSATFSNGSMEGINRYSFTKTNSEWSVKIKKLFKVDFPDQKMHLEWLAEGKCKSIDKKTFKTKIKKGINEQDETL